MIIKLNESNSSVKFSDKYNVFSYEDIPFIKEEALRIWNTLATGYSMIIRNSEGSSYTFEKTSNGMVRYETCKVYRTTTTKNNGDLTYADYKTEKPYNVAPEYEQANLKNAIGSGTATIKIMDKNNNVVSQVKRDFHLKYSPNLTEDLNSDIITLYRSGRLDSPRGIWMTSDKGYTRMYGHDARAYRVHLGNTITVEGYPVTCPILLYDKLHKKKLRGYDNEPVYNLDDLSQTEVNRLTRLYDEIYTGPGKESIRKYGKNYEYNNCIIQYTLDYLNCVEAKKQGYDTIIYKMKAHASDEYCILTKDNIVDTVEEDADKLTERVIYDQETGKICLNYEGAEHIIAQALKDFDTNFEWDSITVVSKNRMRIARAIMQEFKEAGYEPTLDTRSRHKTHEITVPDGEWSGVRISIVSHAVCNPEEQLIEIEVYE